MEDQKFISPGPPEIGPDPPPGEPEPVIPPTKRVEPQPPPELKPGPPPGEPEPYVPPIRKISSPGFEWEVQGLIDSGAIPPPPKEAEYITTVAPYWTGSGWTAKTRPGFEGVPFEPRERIPPQPSEPVPLEVEPIERAPTIEELKPVKLVPPSRPSIVLRPPKLRKTRLTLQPPQLGVIRKEVIGLTALELRVYETLKRDFPEVYDSIYVEGISVREVVKALKDFNPELYDRIVRGATAL